MFWGYPYFLSFMPDLAGHMLGGFLLSIFLVNEGGGSVAEWLAYWTQTQKGLGSNRSCDTVG